MIFYTSNAKILSITISKCFKFTVRTFKISTALSSNCTLAHSPNAKLSKSVLDRYLCLPIPECMCIVKYVWIDGTGDNLRSRSRTLEYIPDCYKEVPNWSYDGSSTYQAEPKCSDNQLVPIAMYNDPFRRGNNKLVLCETYKADNTPTETNHRRKCVESMNKVCDHETMWGLEQQFIFMDTDGRPFGWPVMLGEPCVAGPYYCGVGGNKSYGREIIEAHYRACLYAGIQIGGTNAEVMLSQWKYQIGVCKGIKGADDLWMARFIIARISEEYGITISYAPKFFPHWVGNACYVNLSTKTMRADNGIKAIEDAITKLCKKHKETLADYGGCENNKRLTGKNGESSAETFTNGVADRTASVRISQEVATKKKGHFQDRRPGANADPYRILDAMIKGCLLDCT